MAKQHIKPVDRVFLGIVLAILTVGIFIFVSASLGILVKNEAKFYGIVFNQVVLGLVLGLIGLFFGIAHSTYFLAQECVLYFYCDDCCYGTRFCTGTWIRTRRCATVG